MSAPQTSELSISGMTCTNCARAVTQAIQSTAGVHSANVSLANHHATVRWNSAAVKNLPAVLDSVARTGYEAREVGSASSGASVSPAKNWEWKLILGVGATLVLMAGEWIFDLAETVWFQRLAFALAGLVQVFCGAPFYRGAWNQLKAGNSNMDTLVALGSTTAFGYSAWALLFGRGGHLYFMEAAAIICLISVGHWLEARVSDKAGVALRSLMKLAPLSARRLQPAPNHQSPSEFSALNLKTLSFSQSNENEVIEVPVSDLQTDDQIVLRPGDRVPVDGTVIHGESAVDESMLTGESIPAGKKSGAALFAGTMNLNGRLIMRVTAIGEETALAHVIAAVHRAQTGRAGIQRLGDRISSVFVPFVVVAALGAGLWWGCAPQSALRVHDFLARFLWTMPLPAESAAAFIIAAGVLIIACPCAMGLATPAAIMAGANAAARRGMLIRDGVALEKAGKITAVIFDKTGTLTTGELHVTGPWTPADSAAAKKSAQSLAAALARSSTHPVSRVLAALSGEKIEIKNWTEISGAGVQAEISPDSGGQGIARLGSLEWLRSCDVAIPENVPLVQQWESDGAMLVGLAREKDLLAVFALRDFLKPGASGVVRQLQQQNLKTYLLTGDNPAAAAAMARQIGIDAGNVFAGVRPEQKAKFVKKLQAQGERVAFVGDGINDAPALSQADLGIAVSRASDIAREAADIILLKSEIQAVPESLALARTTLLTIRQNLFWAFFYNALGIPLAALGFISPVFCALAMGASDLVVIGNALRLLGWRPKDQI